MIIWVTGALRRSQVDSEDGFRKRCRNVSRQQQAFSGLHSARWSFAIKVCYSWLQTIFLKCNVVYCIADLHYPWCVSALFGFPALTKAPRRHQRRHQRKCQTSSSMFPFGGTKSAHWCLQCMWISWHRFACWSNKASKTPWLRSWLPYQLQFRHLLLICCRNLLTIANNWEENCICCSRLVVHLPSGETKIHYCNAYTDSTFNPIGHFRVPLSLSFKVSLSAKFLLW